MTAAEDPEAVGPRFSLEKMLEMRTRTQDAVQAIAGRIEVGMTEAEAGKEARRTLAALGLRRGWHPIIVRFGANTARAFMDRSEPDIVLGPDDIFFVDIGPIHRGMEGDAGDTFVTGNDPEHHQARADVHAIWHQVRYAWLTEHLSGRALYRLAQRASAARGWRVNMDLAGHRLSEYSHKAYAGGRLAESDIVPSDYRWIFELAIVHPTRPVGAFYEDLLIRNPVQAG